tara:strand:- start:86 stop:607 length:522 start_codon:yes stop_codon:yes gene_type:complete
MALWGNKDGVYSDGTISVDLGELKITGTGTTFTTAHAAEGNIITVGTGATYGEAVITGRTSATVLTIRDTNNFVSGVTTVTAGAVYNITQKPQSTLTDTNYDANQVFGIDNTEVSVARGKTGNLRKYAPAHSGWVGIQTYTDSAGQFRVKSEVLVASGTITGDAADDSKFADS